MAVRPSHRRFLATWLGCYISAGLLLGVVTGIPRLILLKRHYSTASGVVRKVLPNSHGSVIVRYSSNGQSYEKTFGPITVREGDRATIYFDPADPSVAEIQDPGDRLYDQLGFCLIGAFFAASAITGAAALPRARYRV